MSLQRMLLKPQCLLHARATPWSAPAREFSIVADIVGRFRSWLQNGQQHEPGEHGKTCYLVDGNNLQYYVFDPECSITYKDKYIGATVRFLQRINQMVQSGNLDLLLVLFDSNVVTDRKKENPLYKADRVVMQPRLRPQFHLTEQALRSLHVPIVRVPGIEADDLIASYAKACVDHGYNVVIVSNDNDFLQLVQKTKVSVLKTSRNQLLRERDVRGILHGGKPCLQPDIRALCGDRWGKTPGIPGGISRRDAVELLEKHGGLLELLDNLDQVEDETMRRRLGDAAETLRTSYRMTKLDDQKHLPIAVDDLKSISNFNQAYLEPILGKKAATMVSSSM